VIKSKFQEEPRKLEIYLDFESGRRFECPECGVREESAVHDTAKKEMETSELLPIRVRVGGRGPGAEGEV